MVVVQPEDTRFRTPIPFYVGAPKWRIEPGEEFMALFGTGYGKGRAYVEIEHRGKLLKAYWTNKDETQARVSQGVTEAMRGGFDLRVTFVRENRAYFESKHVEVPWTNKEFKVRWEHFTSKLDPGGKETWTAIIEPLQPGRTTTSQSVESIAAEMVATLYDRSLDQFLPFAWPNSFGVFNQETRYLQQLFGNEPRQFQTFHQSWRTERKPVNITYRRFPEGVMSFRQSRLLTRAPDRATSFRGVEVGAVETGALPSAAPVASAFEAPVASAGLDVAAAKATAGGASDLAQPSTAPETQGKPVLDNVVARRVLSETAFFFPHLVSDTNGHVRISFTVPEALTEWRFLGFAHDRSLRAGILEDSAVTAKELMVQPNPPRFLREGDLLEFAVKVMNQSDRRQQGVVRLTLADSWSGQSADAALNNAVPEKTFDLGPRESASFSWPLRVPEGLTALSYKAVAATATLSDGEEAMLPVLTKRVLVTESLPLPIRGRETRTFEFTKLAESGKSPTLRHQSLTVQMASNPAWYAVLALPYLMEYPYQCSEQVFNRYYANALARFVANSDPKIKRVFELWTSTPALQSPLEKNSELKAVALEESPWLCQAQNETQARHNIGVLFDENRLDAELARALDELKNAQLPDGAWPWFPGGPPNDYITLYICTGFGRLRHLGLDISVDPALRALQRLDSWIDQSHKEILRRKTEEQNHLTSMVALYLYGRSFFVKERPIAPPFKPAFDFFIGQAREHWPKLESR
ncbi:MAG TPA: alpha-2-macroglobulin family protein, partial [Verrucomicrobiota bacterium]|nr:alpha-2-macroglobulin family protein [Verrucomicrobiota bacterium]